jgi:hypothetical protein
LQSGSGPAELLGSAAGSSYNDAMSTGVPPFDVLPGFTPVSTLGPHRAADYFQLPEGEPVELIYGRYAVSPAPTTLHQEVVRGRGLSTLCSANTLSFSRTWCM